jgi:mannonate dehydratase
MIGQTQLSTKTVNRRTFLKSLLVPLLTASGCRYWPSEGFFNDCPQGGLPESLRNHELVSALWEGIDTDQVWDCHCHLLGLGDSDSGIWVNPDMQSLWHPVQYTQFKFYLSASCAAQKGTATVDQGVLARLIQLHQDLPAGYRSMLLALDHYHDEQGSKSTDKTPFAVPNDHARQTASNHHQHFEWIASIHPYRKDAVATLETVVKAGARAVKWLPSVMNIDASSYLCDNFYEALVKYEVPLLTHVGAEYALSSSSTNALNNPLLFRRPLDHGVKVIFAHCATLGESIDLDKGENAPMAPNLELFARLMEDVSYEKQVFGDISAVTQVNRDRWMVEKIIQSEQWHDRLLLGTDYPLPGVLPIYSPNNFVNWGMLTQEEATVLSEVRRYNPILFDVMLKRLLSVNGKQLHKSVFETRRHFV